MNAAWICFHKNYTRYPKQWIEDYKNSIYNQTVKIPIYEINYGEDKKRIFKDSKFYNKPFKTHADAHNFLLDELFSDGFDYAFNSNIDDIYDPTRVEVQSRFEGYDILSSNMYHIDGENRITRDEIRFSEMSIKHHFDRGHNIVAHPAVVYSKRFWQDCPKLNGDLIPKDDFELWKEMFKRGYSFKIVPYALVYYRISDFNISGKNMHA